MDVESILDEGRLEEDSDKCKEFMDLCEEYLVGYIDFYNFISLIDPKNIILCLDDRIFSKLVKRLAEDGIILDTYYDLENLHTFYREKVKLAKFLHLIRNLSVSPDTTYAKIEEVLREFCFTYYYSRTSIEEKQSFVDNFANLLNFTEIKEGR